MEMGWEEIMCLFTAYNDDMTASAQRRFLLSLRLYSFYVELFYLMEFRWLEGRRDAVCMHGTDYT